MDKIRTINELMSLNQRRDELLKEFRAALLVEASPSGYYLRRQGTGQDVIFALYRPGRQPEQITNKLNLIAGYLKRRKINTLLMIDENFNTFEINLLTLKINTL